MIPSLARRVVIVCAKCHMGGRCECPLDDVKTELALECGHPLPHHSGPGAFIQCDRCAAIGTGTKVNRRRQLSRTADLSGELAGAYLKP